MNTTDKYEFALIDKIYYEIQIPTPVIPTKIIYEHKVYNITKLHSSYYITKYYVIVNNKKDNIIKEIYLYKCFHPNAFGKNHPDINNPPLYSKMCLPDWMIDKSIFTSNRQYLKIKGERIFTSKDFERDFLYLWQMDNPHHYLRKEYVNAERKYFNGTMERILKLPHYCFI